MSSQELFCTNCGAANVATARFCQYCATALPFKHTTGSLPEQTMLNGRYQLESRIGQGGMGAVYKAVDTRFNNRPIAVKEMSRTGLSEAAALEAEAAFEHESHLLADLLHPNLPRIYDHFTENERSYLAMDFIEGETLEDYLERAGGKPMSLQQVLSWGIELCDVLHYLHSHQPAIVFRDLKPSNVMISNSEHIYLIDFGIARVFKPGQLHDTVALGSPGFAAPEQYGKAQSTPRSDIYSLGALLHCLLTGADPSEQPFFFRPASQLNPAIPFELEKLLQQMLEMDSEKRPASVQDVSRVLRHIEQQLASGTLPPNPPRATSTKSTVSQLLQDANRFYAQKRLRDALVAYDKAIQIDSTEALAWQGRGLTQAMSGQHYDALTSFERALQLDSSMIIALNGKGTALNILHRNQEAQSAFDRVIQLEPDNALAWNGKGAVLSALGKPREALTAFEAALHFDPHLAKAWGNKGLILRQLKDYQKALQAFEQALSFDATSVVYWNGKGLCLLDMRRFKQAIQTFQEALNRDSNFAPAWFGIGNAYYALHRLRDALNAYERALKIDPRFVKALERRGNVLADMGNLYKALDSYDEALRVDPRSAAAWNSKGSVLCQLERYEQALDAYSRALVINPNVPQAWNGKGNAYYHLHSFEMALDSYNRALQLNPDMASAFHNKSLTLKLMRRFSEALEAADEAVRLAPNDPDNWLRKAEALRKLRRTKEARKAEAQATLLREQAAGP